jgi:RecB family endonuclease NucS
MADMKLFRLEKDDVAEITARSVAVEKSLQSLIERHLEKFMSVRFLASEYSTGKTHKGRIDTLGIDENGSPVIIEYKRALNENVINQGLFYLDWLLDHKAEFELLVANNSDKRTHRQLIGLLHASVALPATSRGMTNTRFSRSIEALS